MKYIALLAIVATVASALPAPEEKIVPEAADSFLLDSFLQEKIRSFQQGASSPQEAARKAYEFVQQSSSDTECRRTANAMVTAVTEAIRTAQANLNAVDVGNNCASLGQDEVDAAQAEDTANQAAVATADAAFQNATSTPITMTALYNPGQECAVATDNAAWQAAAAAYTAATSAQQAAGAAAAASATALQQAQAAQQGRVHRCECDAHHRLAQSVAANTANTAQLSADWNQAHQLLCVLDNTSPCNFAAAPSVTPPQAPPGVANIQCEAPTAAPTSNAPTNAPTNAPSTNPTANPTNAPTTLEPTAAPTTAPTSTPTVPLHTWVVGDGSGGSEQSLGSKAGRDACLRAARNVAGANGASYFVGGSGDDSPNGSCYAETGMTTTNGNDAYRTYRFAT